MKPILSFIFLIAALVAPVAAAAAAAHQVVPYKEIDGKTLQLFVLRPEDVSAKKPAIVFFHGGGWNKGSAEKSLGFLRHFQKAGFVCISVHYRLRDLDGGTTPMDATCDARSAIRAVFQRAEEFGIDPERVIAAGSSAGGHLACMAALGDGLDEPSEKALPVPKIAALLLWNPVVDTTDKGYGGTRRFGRDTEKYSPVHLLRKDSPPALVQHGDADETVPYENAERFVATANKHGIDSKLITYPGGKHSFFSGQENRNHLLKSYQEADAFIGSLGLSSSQKQVAPKGTAIPKLELDLATIDRERILKASATALQQAPVTITTHRGKHSEGGPNDFHSNADYFWPDPSKPDGLPYIARDGQSNPDNFNEHRKAVKTLRDSVAALAAAYHLTGDEKYVVKAAEFLRVFFLDRKTRMNPNLNYAQAVLGVAPGRSYGIIDALHFIEIPIAVSAMESSKAFPQGMGDELRQWFGELSRWMLTSENGIKEGAAKNNHAVTYYLKIAVFAKFTGDQALLAASRKQYKEVFVGKQMAEDGSFPLELARTKPYAYSIFQLDNMATLCQVLSTPEDDLWAFALPDGRGIRKAAAYLYPFLKDKSKWPLAPDVQAWDGWPARQPHLIFAGLALGESAYLDLARKLPPDPSDPEVQRNIAITQPILWVR